MGGRGSEMHLLPVPPGVLRSRLQREGTRLRSPCTCLRGRAAHDRKEDTIAPAGSRSGSTASGSVRCSQKTSKSCVASSAAAATSLSLTATSTDAPAPSPKAALPGRSGSGGFRPRAVSMRLPASQYSTSNSSLPGADNAGVLSKQAHSAKILTCEEGGCKCRCWHVHAFACTFVRVREKSFGCV